MTIYIAMFILCSLLMSLSEKFKKGKILRRICIALAIIIPAAIAGFRDLKIGTDIKVYGEFMFYIAINSPNNFFNLVGYSDILFSVFTLITNIIFKDIHVYLFLLQLVNCFVIYISCKRMNEKCPIWLSYLIFLMTLYFRQLNLLRQGISLSFSILAVTHLLKDENNKKFYFWTIIASLFHISSLITLILPWVKKVVMTKKNLKKEKLSLFYISLIFIFIFFLPILKLITSSGILSSKYSYDYFLNLANTENGIDSLGTTFYLLLCVISFFISLRKEIKNKIDSFNFWFHLCFISFILYMLNVYILYIDRISFCFVYPVILFYVPQFKFIFKNDYVNRILAYFVIILLVIIYWFIRFIYQNAGAVYPYMRY